MCEPGDGSDLDLIDPLSAAVLHERVHDQEDASAVQSVLYHRDRRRNASTCASDRSRNSAPEYCS
jgi:hypothetical protein